MSTRQVFCFKERHRSRWCEWFQCTSYPELFAGLIKLFGINVPVCSQLNLTSKCLDERKTWVAMDSSLQLTGFWPRVRVEHPMLLNVDVFMHQALPKALTFGPNKKIVRAFYRVF